MDLDSAMGGSARRAEARESPAPTRPSTLKQSGPNLARIVPPETTLSRIQPVLKLCGITRIANVTGLDRPGIPVVAVMRPNSRSYAVAQGKGTSLAAAKVSGLMESIENYHAEEASLPLRLGRFAELSGRHVLADVSGLPRLATSRFNEQTPLLWVEGALDLVTGERTLVPHDLVHLDFRTPLPPGSGCFLMSSNGLASGNHLVEAISHALCEVIERDANTLWHVSGDRAQQARRIDLATVDDPQCRQLLAQLDQAEIDVLAWDTTTDVRIASVLCDVFDRRSAIGRPMPAVQGSGCHPCRRIALSRALTEAVQGRLTRIAGARDDLSLAAFDDAFAHRSSSEARKKLSQGATVSFLDLPNVENETVDGDMRTICDALVAAELRQILMLNLTRSDLNIPVVRVVVPHLEAMNEIPGYVLGVRARRAAAAS